MPSVVIPLTVVCNVAEQLATAGNSVEFISLGNYIDIPPGPPGPRRLMAQQILTHGDPQVPCSMFRGAICAY